MKVIKSLSSSKSFDEIEMWNGIRLSAVSMVTTMGEKIITIDTF